MNPRTELAVRFVNAADPCLTDANIVRDIVRAVNGNFDTDGFVDSHKVADAFVIRRAQTQALTPDWSQTKDYVQHLFREADHVCRHADGHDYRIHRAAKCSADCDTKYATTTTTRRPVSACCFVETTTQGTCPFGCDD